MSERARTSCWPAEREQIEQEIAALEREGPEEGDERREPGDFNSEGLYQDEFDAGRAQDLTGPPRRRSSAPRRASPTAPTASPISSGEPIPDERLEGNPTAELTGRSTTPTAAATGRVRKLAPRRSAEADVADQRSRLAELLLGLLAGGELLLGEGCPGFSARRAASS